MHSRWRDCHEKDLKSQLLHSFHNVIGFGPNTFKSKSSQRHRRRPRKSRSSRQESSRSSPAPPHHVERAARAGRAPYVDPHAEQQLGGWEAQLMAAGGPGLELTGGASSSYWPHDSDQLGGASQPVFLAEQMQLKDEAAMQPTLSMWPESWQMPWPESLHMLAWDVPGSGSVLEGNAETPAASARVVDGLASGLWGDHDQWRNAGASVLEAENKRLRAAGAAGPGAH